MTTLQTGSGSAPSLPNSRSNRHLDAVQSISTPGIELSLLGLPVRDSIYRIPALEQYPDLLHGISTRCSPEGNDWNLSAKRGTPQNPPSIETAYANRRKLADALSISFDSIVGCQQVHSAEVALVGAGDGGRGMRQQLPSVQGVDALITNTPGLYLMALAADCPPVFFYDPVRRAIGLAHSGWKGTVGRIADNVVAAMVDNFGSSPSDIIAAVGPGIGPCCYAVGPNVIEAVEQAFSGNNGSDAALVEARNGAIYFNLRETIYRTLLAAGVRPENIAVDEVCTAHNVHTFYSHRGEAGQCGLFGAIFGLRA